MKLVRREKYAIFNNAIIQQLAFFAFVCIAQLFLALRYIANPDLYCTVVYSISIIMGCILYNVLFAVIFTKIDVGFNIFAFI